MMRRIVLVGLLAVLVWVVGVGVGFVRWGLEVRSLTAWLQQERSECSYRVEEIKGRLAKAEERTEREREARQVLEEELHQLRPLK